MEPTIHFFFLEDSQKRRMGKGELQCAENKVKRFRNDRDWQQWIAIELKVVVTQCEVIVIRNEWFKIRQKWWCRYVCETVNSIVWVFVELREEASGNQFYWTWFLGEAQFLGEESVRRGWRASGVRAAAGEEGAFCWEGIEKGDEERKLWRRLTWVFFLGNL